MSTKNCDTHGEYEYTVRQFGSRTVESVCPECREIENARYRADRERESAEESRRHRRKAAAVPLHFADATVSEVPAEVAGWFASERRGPLVISGPVGTGKTHLAVAALNRHIDHGASGLYLSAADYGRRVRASWGKHSEESESYLLERYSRTSFLVFDELGASRSIDEAIIQDLLCARYEASRMSETIFVTNIAPANFDATLGERVADRIREGAALYLLTGKSRRQSAA